MKRYRVIVSNPAQRIYDGGEYAIITEEEINSLEVGWSNNNETFSEWKDRIMKDLVEV